MPGEWLPDEDLGYLRGVHAHAAKIGAGVGGPDLLPFRRGQREHGMKLLSGRKHGVIGALAVQDGNLAEIDPRTGRAVTPAELARVAERELRLDYLFWGTEEPYYTAAVLPFVCGLATKR
jgi:hypothetical protein